MLLKEAYVHKCSMHTFYNLAFMNIYFPDVSMFHKVISWGVNRSLSYSSLQP